MTIKKDDAKRFLLALSMLGLVFLVLPLQLLAQGPGMPGDPGYDPDNEVPIDGGIGLLLAAGVAYGVKKIKDSGIGSRPG